MPTAVHFNDMNKIDERIELLRKQMKPRCISAYIVPTSDFHSSEYVGDYFKEREFITGFDGSAGTAVITHSGAYLWTDGRYFLQAAQQLAGSSVKLMKMNEPKVPILEDFLAKELPDGAIVGVDARCVQASFMESLADAFNLQKKSVSSFSEDIIGALWTDRPALSCEPIVEYDEKLAGATRVEKLDQLRAMLKERELDFFIATTLDDIAWLLNIRGNDVECNPVPLSYFVMDGEHPVLFAQEKAVASVKAVLERDGIEVREYDDFYKYIALCCRRKKVAFDRANVNYKVVEETEAADAIIEINVHDFIRKHVKNATELENMVYAHLKDGVAKTRWIYWLKQNVGKIAMDEISVAEKLHEFRAEQENFMGDSFDPIMGYEEHGAIIHYSATPESKSEIKAKGWLLADTGAQFLEGTTDVTRTIALGNLKARQIADYTTVLRSHLALQNVVFKAGTDGHWLDGIARKVLKDVGKNYNHGTGHGVGVYLNVHEDPVRISTVASRALAFCEGMITSDEPGIYEEGSHGVRIENLLVCLEAEEGAAPTKGAKSKKPVKMLKFEPLTLIPYDRAAVDATQMSEEEKGWYNQYQALVFEKISPFLNDEEKKWLAEETKAL